MFFSYNEEGSPCKNQNQSSTGLVIGAYLDVLTLS